MSRPVVPARSRGRGQALTQSSQRQPLSAGRPAIEGLEFAQQAARIAHDHRAEDVVILDLRGICSVADFFIIATGTSDRQLRAVADHIETYGRTVGQTPYGISGRETATWILVDYVDVVIHLFDPQKRQYYDLELLWGDAPRVDWDTEARSGK